MVDVIMSSSSTKETHKKAKLRDKLLNLVLN